MTKDLESIVKQLVKDIHLKHAQIIEDFAKAYLAETKLMPSEVELCQQMKGTVITWWFRKREEPKEPT